MGRAEASGSILSLSAAVAAASIVWSGCPSGGVVRPHPVMSLDSPEGATLQVSRGAEMVRVPFDGRARLAPFLCTSKPIVINVEDPKEKKNATLKWLASKPGSRRVRIVSKSGEVLASGRLCIFPTYETPTMEILYGYSFRVPIHRLRQRPPGKPAAIYQLYGVAGRENPALRHVAWVMWIPPR